MKLLLSISCAFMLFSALVFQVSAKDHGKGKGRGNGHGYSKNYYKKQKHYCNMYCHHDSHHYYREKVIIVQPAPRPGLNINLAL